jgi:hypothetical protein
MECDALQKGKGKGKKKGRVKNKSKDECGYCGKLGHWKSECWQREKESGKGTSSTSETNRKGKGKGRRSDNKGNQKLDKHVNEVENTQEAIQEVGCDLVQDGQEGLHGHIT